MAVLPFDNLSAEPGSQYMALGIAESVLNRLGSIHELIVIARSSSFSLGNSHPDAREIGRKLGVEYLVEGSVQRAGCKQGRQRRLVDDGYRALDGLRNADSGPHLIGHRPNIFVAVTHLLRRGRNPVVQLLQRSRTRQVQVSIAHGFVDLPAKMPRG